MSSNCHSGSPTTTGPVGNGETVIVAVIIFKKRRINNSDRKWRKSSTIGTQSEL